ncbi:MAG: DUF350 domain-containing protein [Lentisphaerae bacterium]|jgi:uncharacterized membrane protein YjfL (UPF0719 family)|nr:DUF350 domain-containing protein [Lentisphaerota bacterium]MBT4819672.1 DUF350 domain-containing protein [Lentisphaerota bacterium]MBT5608044.1 DUF350 domain-containing protein [Lentisphaerota bacterium]MBT7056488.1 DUF350 domain-containing protein [Lentisphaerota bacterium]MBT7840719.1 DUF350 domain-containing protein [Lentisphaerota bacterium]
MEELTWMVYAAGYVLAAMVLLWFSKKLFDVLTTYSVERQLTEKDNPAVGLLLTGFFLGIIAVLCGVFMGDNEGELTLDAFLGELGPVVLYAFLGMLLLFLAGVVNDKLILHSFDNEREIIDSKNTAVAVIMFATYVGSGLVIAGGIHGCTGMLSAVIGFGAGQCALVAFAALYQRSTGYDDQEEIGKNRNVAAGTAFGGNVLAYSIILMKGLTMQSGELTTVWDRSWHFGYYAIAGGLLLIVTRIINDRVFLPSARIRDEVVRDRNINAGYMEATLAIGMGVILVVCL